MIHSLNVAATYKSIDDHISEYLANGQKTGMFRIQSMESILVVLFRKHGD
jgi:hypothetical protein